MDCLQSRDTCRDTTCPAEAKACVDKADARRKAECPNCDEVKSCLAEYLYGKKGEGLKDWAQKQKKADAECAKRTPTNKECLKLCQPDP
jgi:hypothetical protein